MKKIMLLLHFVLITIPCYSSSEQSAADSLYRANKNKEIDSLSKETQQALFPALLNEFDKQQDSLRVDSVHFDSLRNVYLKENYKTVNRAYLQERKRRTYTYDSLYLANKTRMDAGRERHFLVPYYTNFSILEIIDDSTDAGKEKSRIAVKFQISQKIPWIVHRYYNTGLYIGMTFRGLFDIGNLDDSQPISRKTFLPEAYLSFDFASLSALDYPDWLQWMGNLFPPQRDRNVLQWGLQHESNGGKGADSRGIQFRHYVTYTYKFIPVQKTDSIMGIYTDYYKHRLYIRMFAIHGIEDNLDIKEYIGFMDMQWDFQFSPFKRGIWELMAWVNPSFSKDDWSNIEHTGFCLGFAYTFPWNLSYKKYHGRNPFKYMYTNLHLPISVYFRYWNGHNEYLLKYWKRSRTKGVGFGIKFRK